jgi:GTP cyclohydrolase II
MPYFYSDLFEFGYEAVGEVDASLETVTDWQKENEKGVIYYLREGKVRGAMMCDVWDKVDAARELILAGEWADAQSVQGLIR